VDVACKNRKEEGVVQNRAGGQRVDGKDVIAPEQGTIRNW